MPISHLLLALLVVIIWGLNFIFVELSLKEISPLVLCSFRFFLACVPAIFFVKPPKAPLKYILAYGILMFGLQFSLLFMGLYAGMMPGLGSILMQIQVFFSMFFACILLKEIPTRWQILGALISFSGIGLVGMHLEHGSSLLGFILIIGAAATWGLGNLITKKMSSVSMISLVVWGSFIAFIPLTILALAFEGPRHVFFSLRHLSWLGLSSVLFIVYFSTWIGYGVWNWLVSRYPVSTIVPFTMLVPVFTMVSSIIVFHESFQLWKLCAGLLVITGLGINFATTRFLMRRKLAALAQDQFKV